MDLAFRARISPRHMSFIETGRAAPGRSVVLQIADALEMPLRDRNALLEAAGYARLFSETHLDDADLGPVRRVLEFLLERHEPYSAIVLDRRWNVIMANAAHHALLPRLVPRASLEDPSLAGNLLRLLFDPKGLRPRVANWEEVAGTLIERLHRQSLGRPDRETEGLLDELLEYPDVPEAWRSPDLTRPMELLLPVHLETDDLELRLISTITVFGTPQDVTLEEIRLETFFPADADTERALRQLARSRGAP
jgi:transcriptional regulator with XRE-family HTH domain